MMYNLMHTLYVEPSVLSFMLWWILVYIIWSISLSFQVHMNVMLPFQVVIILRVTYYAMIWYCTSGHMVSDCLLTNLNVNIAYRSTVLICAVGDGPTLCYKCSTSVSDTQLQTVYILWSLWLIALWACEARTAVWRYQSVTSLAFCLLPDCKLCLYGQIKNQDRIYFHSQGIHASTGIVYFCIDIWLAILVCKH